MSTPTEWGYLTGERDIAGVVFDAAAIEQRVAELGRAIAEEYPDGDLLLLGLLKGCFVFLADLVRRIPRHLEVDFLAAQSYGQGYQSSGDVRITYDSSTPLEGKHVLVVEDIIDSGNTLNRLVRLLRRRNPRTLEVCTLLHKRTATLELEPRFVGFDAPPDFLVGYGLDHAEDFRHLPFIARIEQ